MKRISTSASDETMRGFASARRAVGCRENTLRFDVKKEGRVVRAAAEGGSAETTRRDTDGGTSVTPNRLRTEDRCSSTPKEDRERPLPSEWLLEATGDVSGDSGSHSS